MRHGHPTGVGRRVGPDRPQRVRAPFLAIAFRFLALSLAARTRPPTRPPFRRASVVGVSGGIWVSSLCQVAISPITFASCMGSRGRFGRLAMA
jgi:hypothetical protein